MKGVVAIAVAALLACMSVALVDLHLVLHMHGEHHSYEFTPDCGRGISGASGFNRLPQR